MYRILVVEDEASIRDFVVFNLKKAGYEVREAETGEAALRIFMEDNGNFQVALLDLMLPGVDGLTVCRELRKASRTLGIIMLTARTQEADKIGGFSSGADDYVTKPFSPAELLARVESLLRRVDQIANTPEPTVTDTLTEGDYELNLRRRTLKKRGQLIEVTQVEFQILEYFFSNPNQALDRTEILDRVWGDDYVGEEKIVDVNIRRLRIKLEDDPSHPVHILTVWGRGYQWKS